MDKLITIVATVYNKEIYLGYCFTLLNEQLLKLDQIDRDKIELLIIDDCSTDNSMTLINSILNPNIDRRIIHNDKRMNIAYVRWEAVNNINSKYFIFLDVDDLICEDYIQTLLNVNFNTFADIYQFKGREYPNGVLIDYDSTWTPIKLIKTSFIKKHNINFDPNKKPEINEDDGSEAVIAEDLDFYNQIIQYKPIINNIDKVLVIWNFAIPDSLTKVNYSYLHFISKP